MTLEYDLALANWQSEILIITGMANEAELRRLAKDPNDCDASLAELIADDAAKEGLDRLRDDERQKAFYATCYLLSVESKGEIAFDLMHQLRENLIATADTKLALEVPKHIEEAIRFACRQTTAGG